MLTCAKTTLAAMCLFVGSAVSLFAQDDPPDLSILTAPGTTFVDGDRLLFLGDSITQFADSPQGFITLVRKAFAAAGSPKVEVVNVGVGGNKVPNLQERLERDVLSKDPSVVFVYIGINDVWHHGGDLGAPLTAFQTGLRDVIGRIQAHGAVVILATPTVIGEKPEGGNKLDASLDVFAENSRTIAKDMDVELCDLRKAFTEYLKANNSAGLEKGVLTVDGVHLNPNGDRLVAQELVKSLVAGIPRAATFPIVAGGDFVDQVDVTMALRPGPKTAGVSIHYTTDGSEPVATSPIYHQPIVITTTSSVKARSFRKDTAVSTTITCVCTKLVPRVADQAPACIPGLTYSYYEAAFSKLPDFKTLTPLNHGISPTLDITLRKRDDNYAFHFAGYLKVPVSAVYDFGLSSDDGSHFLLGDAMVVNDDGQHGWGFLHTKIALQAGMHACTIDYFQAAGDQSLQLTWSRPGQATEAVPASAFFTPEAAH